MTKELANRLIRDAKQLSKSPDQRDRNDAVEMMQAAKDFLDKNKA